MCVTCLTASASASCTEIRSWAVRDRYEERESARGKDGRSDGRRETKRERNLRQLQPLVVVPIHQRRPLHKETVGERQEVKTRSEAERQRKYLAPLLLRRSHSAPLPVPLALSLSPVVCACFSLSLCLKPPSPSSSSWDPCFSPSPAASPALSSGPVSLSPSLSLPSSLSLSLCSAVRRSARARAAAARLDHHASTTHRATTARKNAASAQVEFSKRCRNFSHGEVRARVSVLAPRHHPRNHWCRTHR